MRLIWLWLLFVKIECGKIASLPKTDIIHTDSGLILHYLTEYKPSNEIVTFSVDIPMVSDMCYLLPRVSMKKIPACVLGYVKKINRTGFSITEDQNMTVSNREHLLVPNPEPSTEIPNRLIRNKRLITDIISIGIGSAALALSGANTAQIANLKSAVQLITNNLERIDQRLACNTVQLLHLSEGQLKLTQELNFTQNALNKTIAIVNQHSEILREHEAAFRALIAQAMLLRSDLASVIHAVETHFIHTSIGEIMKNNLNLQFIHPKDLPSVIETIIQVTNISLDESNSSISSLELVTRLLVQQRIDFILNNHSESINSEKIIGRLIFTSFFAAPKKTQAPFLIFKLVPIPFTYKMNRVRLAQMPEIIGVEIVSGQFIRWTTQEAKFCNFELMSSCRETPPIRNEIQDECLLQILSDRELVSCKVEPFPDPVFIHRIGQHWAISTNVSNKCHSVTTLDVEEHRITKNEQITLPKVALITTVGTDSLVCDQFSLPSIQRESKANISIVANASINQFLEQIMDIQAILENNTKWAKLPYIPAHLEALVKFITKSPPVPLLNTSLQWLQPSIPLLSLLIMLALILIGLRLYLIINYRVKSEENHPRRVEDESPFTNMRF